MHNAVVELNAVKRPHKNFAHSKGKRIVLVCCNFDMDFKGRSNDARTVELKKLYADLDDNYLEELEVNEGPVVDFARGALLEDFEDADWEDERCNGGDNHSKYLLGQEKIKKMSMGAVRLFKASATLLTRRSSRKKTKAERKMWKSLQRYFKVFCPRLCEYDSCFVAIDALCDWHVDSNSNIGPSAITAIGDFEGGGELLVRLAPVKKTMAATATMSGSGGGGGSSKDSAPAPSPAGE